MFESNTSRVQAPSEEHLGHLWGANSASYSENEPLKIKKVYIISQQNIFEWSFFLIRIKVEYQTQYHIPIKLMEKINDV